MLDKRKAVFLDKDGTLIPDIPYNVNPELITLEDGVLDGLKLLQQAGYIFIVISNQAGVAKGHFTIDKLEKVKEKLDLLLAKDNIKIEAFYFCPHHPEGTIAAFSVPCNCRKPQPGMIIEAAADKKIDVEKSWMIGDILNDVEAGNRAGCQTIIIDNGNETEWIKGSFRTPTFSAKNFFQAATFIVHHSHDRQLNDKKLEGL